MRRLSARTVVASSLLLALGAASCTLEAENPKPAGAGVGPATTGGTGSGGGATSSSATAGSGSTVTGTATTGSGTSGGTGGATSSGSGGASTGNAGSSGTSGGAGGSSTGAGGASGSGGGSTRDAGPMIDGSVSAPDSAVGGATKLSTHVAPLLKANCALAGCHDAIKKEHGIDFSTAATTHASLVNKMTADHCRNNAAVTRVIPGQPQNSFVLVMVEGVGRCTEMPRMPVAPRTALTASQIQVIRDWIAAGALND